MTVALIDLGYGNVGSVQAALQRLGADVIVTQDGAEIARAGRVLLPGVGAAGYAMARIETLGLTETLRQLRQPMLGICLGMHLLFDASEENDVACLGLLPGIARRLHPVPGRPVPHMGWSRLALRDEQAGLRTGDYAYFAHSFAIGEGPDILATAEYGATITAAVRRGNLLGAQFHPERSGEAGARFLAAFLSC